MQNLEEKKKQLIPELLPRHVAIIMDGNGRWAEKKRLDRIKGHQKGLEAVRKVVEVCGELGIKVLTLYAFSKENWLRPREEVNELMRLLNEYLIKEGKTLVEKNIRLRPIGDLEDLPKGVYRALMRTVEMTEGNTGLILNLALSYSGRWEIIQGIRKAIQELKSGGLKEEDLTPDVFSRFLSTEGLPDPDLLIRTSGEQRISNFFLWQIAYTELYFTKTLWPDFGEEEFIDALLDYQSRERRFGLLSSQIRQKLQMGGAS